MHGEEWRSKEGEEDIEEGEEEGERGRGKVRWRMSRPAKGNREREEEGK